MRKSKFSESQIFSILKEAEAGVPIRELCRTHQISEPTFYNWRSKYGGMNVSMMKRLKELEQENNRLKKMYAEVCMDKIVLQEIVEKKW
jgi:putative transposase